MMQPAGHQLAELNVGRLLAPTDDPRVAEFMGASQGLGAVVIAAQGMMDTTLMFAALVLIAMLGLMLYQACLLLERRLLRAHYLSTPQSSRSS